MFNSEWLKLSIIYIIININQTIENPFLEKEKSADLQGYK